MKPPSYSQINTVSELPLVHTTNPSRNTPTNSPFLPTPIIFCYQINVDNVTCFPFKTSIRVATCSYNKSLPQHTHPPTLFPNSHYFFLSNKCRQCDMFSIQNIYQSCHLFIQQIPPATHPPTHPFSQLPLFFVIK